MSHVSVMSITIFGEIEMPPLAPGAKTPDSANLRGNPEDVGSNIFSSMKM